jgi:hypothetical protein
MLRRSVLAALTLTFVTQTASAQDSTSRHWPRFIAGAVTSVLAHEAGHVGTSLMLGARPTFGFDEGRPTVYSGISLERDPRKQFLFSAAGLTVQSVLDEAILDAPRGGGSFERGMLAGGIGTTLFYLTIGRNGSVSDVAYIARSHVLNKTQATFIYGGIAAVHLWRIAHDGRFVDFFAQPRSDGRAMLVGVRR